MLLEFNRRSLQSFWKLTAVDLVSPYGVLSFAPLYK